MRRRVVVVGIGLIAAGVICGFYLWSAVWRDYSCGWVQLFTHCGLDVVVIGGEWWMFVPQVEANPPPGFGNPVDIGTIRLLDEHHAEYTVVESCD